MADAPNELKIVLKKASDLLAMDKAMELYIEFQNQFGGQLADAVPTEEFEALQACLSSADYDGALEDIELEVQAIWTQPLPEGYNTQERHTIHPSQSQR